MIYTAIPLGKAWTVKNTEEGSLVGEFFATETEAQTWAREADAERDEFYRDAS